MSDIEIIRLMPTRYNLGEMSNTMMGGVILNKTQPMAKNVFGYREVMGYFIPEWQRGIVWEQDRQIKLLESLWKGISIGSFTYNEVNESEPSPYDNLLIDGQQRMHSIECYLNDEFPVFGYKWSEITIYDKRGFKGLHFASYRTKSTNESYLRDYYNIMNFGGIAHKDGEQA